jgi:hypothetical protein
MVLRPGHFFNLNLSLTTGKILLINYLSGMKKILTLFITLASLTAAMAQDSTATAPLKTKKRDWSKVNLSNRPNDHFMLQIGYNGWAQMPDTINTKGIPRSFNFYFMFDLPFKTDPRWSVGIGAGIGSDNMYFDKTEIDITGRRADKISFRNVADTNHFKRYKLNTTFLEAPIELRFAADPENTNKSWKFAVGGKVGTMLSAYVKGKTFQNKAGNTINAYTLKEKSKRYFNSTRLSITGRISHGIVGLYGSYQVNAFIKEGYGPDIRPFQIGIVLSGL